MIDPWLSYFGHPKLPAGYNADDNDGDEVNGSGTNWPVWPRLFDTFVAFEVLLITQEMLDFFETGCPDYVVSPLDNDLLLSREQRVYVAEEEGSSSIRIAAVNSMIVFPREHRSYLTRKAGNSVEVASVDDTNVLSREVREQTMRRRA